MHFKNINFFYFVDNFNKALIGKLPKNTSIIYRNYQKPIDVRSILKLKNICKKKDIKFFLSNNIKLAIKLGLDGAYLPAFSKTREHNSFNFKKRFQLIGSAHNLKEIREKERQNVNCIFLSPIFLTEKRKDFLGIYKFMNLMKLTDKKIACLGGININNIKKLKMLKLDTIAGIRLFNDKNVLKII
jgi:thiamine-phosphate pyrophosphorylase